MLKRNIKITFRLCEKEDAHLKKQVKRVQLSQEAYLRSLILGYAPREPPTADYYAFMKELRAIGNRINQIAVKANSTGFIQADEYEQNAKKLFEILLDVQAAVTLPQRS